MTTCANPLFVEWLQEWMDEARVRNSKGHLVYKKAWQSMKACTVTFQHASEGDVLNGIGPKLCKRLADKHSDYCNENGLPQPTKPRKKTRIPANDDSNDEGEVPRSVEQQPTKSRKQKEYVPKLRSGAWALIEALGELDEHTSQGLSKKDLINRAQPYCDSSFTVPSDTTKMYTAWKSMETLEKKELVYTRGHPTKRYCLTDEGWITARGMQAQDNPDPGAPPAKSSKAKSGLKASSSSRPSIPESTSNMTDVVDLDSDLDDPVQCTPLPKLINIKDSGLSTKKIPVIDTTSSEPIVLKAGTFEVKLLLDMREIRARHDRDYMVNELKMHDVLADVRSLPLGDFLWIAKLKPPHDSAFRLRNSHDDEVGSDEIVLEHVVERKRLDDLVSSIKDGRFHEQKFRLKKSGMRNVTYLVETFSISAECMDIYGQSIDSAIAQMQVVDDIFVKQTDKIQDTVKYIARTTRSLKQMYEQKDLHVLPSSSLDVATYHKGLEQLRSSSPSNAYCITFSAFCALCDKSDSLTLRDLYLKMLMCMRGVTGDKAIEIQKIWPTPNAFIEAYTALGKDKIAKDKMVSNRLGKEIDRKKVGATLSAKIAEVWGT